MPIDSEDLKVYAEKIAISAEGEVEYRAATSRAYYSIFHKTKQLGYVALPGDEGSHKRYIDALMRADNESARKAGRVLDQCKQLRVAADYHIQNEFDKYDMQEAVAMAVRLHKLVEKEIKRTVQEQKKK